jgi:Holliday junction resolvase
MREQTIQRNITKFLEKNGAYVVKVISASKAGVPDILGCYLGSFFAIEVKTPDTKTNVSKLQNYNLEQVKKAGGYSIVAWEISQVNELLEEIENGNS